MNIVDALSHRTIIEEARTRNVAENGVHQFVANTAELKAMTGEETEATSGVDDELESLRQCIKPEIGRMQVVQTTSQSEMNFVFLEIWSCEQEQE